MNFSTRPARDEDEPFLYDLYRSTRIEELSRTGLPPAQLDMLIKLQFTAQQHHYREAYPNAEHLIIMVEDRPAGRVLIYRSDLTLQIVDIAFLPERRGSGIGSEVIRRLQAEAAAALKPLTLYVVKHNPAARLYERLGFKTVQDIGSHFFMEWHSPA